MSPAEIEAFRAENLTYEAGGRRLFENLSFSLKRGESLYVSGANGSGKTSLLSIAARLRQPQQGGIHYRGLLHYVGHENAAAPSLTVRETLAFWARLYRVFDKAQKERALQNALRFAGLASLQENLVALLSAGQKRRLALSRLILAPPRDLWILDEAEQSLDAQARESLRGLISQHIEGGGILIMAGHDAPPSSAREIRLGANPQTAP